MNATRLPPPRQKQRTVSVWKSIVVLGGAIVLTTLAIEASDTFRIPGVSLLAGVGGSITEEKCPSDMVFVSGGGGFCIDRYEAASGEFCGHKDPLNQFETNENIAQPKCGAVSNSGQRPWVNISLHQAMSMCARAGKHLATPEEWYRAALGTPDAVSKDKKQCALGRAGQARADNTGSHDACVSSYGTYDMVGNVWEWVDAEVADGVYSNRTLPTEGYVSEADLGGVPITTGSMPQDTFGGDHWFIESTGVRAMFRGGFWSMEEKAGIYAINATIQPSFIGVAVGFRCAR